MRSIIGFSAESGISLELHEGGIIVCRKCRVADPLAKTDIYLPGAKDIKKHLREHMKARHTGVDEAKRRLAFILRPPEEGGTK